MSSNIPIGDAFAFRRPQFQASARVGTPATGVTSAYSKQSPTTRVGGGSGPSLDADRCRTAPRTQHARSSVTAHSSPSAKASTMGRIQVATLSHAASKTGFAVKSSVRSAGAVRFSGSGGSPDQVRDVREVLLAGARSLNMRQVYVGGRWGTNLQKRHARANHWLGTTRRIGVFPRPISPWAPIRGPAGCPSNRTPNEAR